MDRPDEGTQFSIREHAAEWFLRLHAHDLSVAERFAYLQWLKASPAHIGETLQICQLYSILYPLKQQLYFTNEDDVSNVIDLPRDDDVAPPARTRRSWHIRALVVAVGFGLAILAGSIAQRAWLETTIETQASEWRSLALSDGSLLSVGPRTQLSNQFGGRQRLLRLARHADDPASFAESIAAAKKGIVVYESREVIRLQPSAQAQQPRSAAGPLSPA
jgi:transmembrane sensor